MTVQQKKKIEAQEYMDIWIYGYMDIWIYGYMGIRLFQMVGGTENGVVSTGETNVTLKLRLVVRIGTVDAYSDNLFGIETRKNKPIIIEQR